MDNIHNTVLELSKESTQNISNHHNTKTTLKELGEKINLLLKKEQLSRRHDSGRKTSALDDRRESNAADSPGFIQNPHHEIPYKRSSQDKTSNLLRAALHPRSPIDVDRSKENDIEEVSNFVFRKCYSALFLVDHASCTE